jgi:hypothetical protein
VNLASFQFDAELLTLCYSFVTLAPFHMRNSSLAKSGVAARVLLVDDNRDGLLARKSLLEEQGFIAVTALNGEEAFETLSKMTFDLMVTVEPFYARFYIYQPGFPESLQHCCGN